MQGGVKKRKGRTLSGAIEGAARGQLCTALDVTRGERTERTRRFRGSEIREVPVVEGAEPARDTVHSYSAPRHLRSDVDDSSGGEEGIRTPGTLSSSTVFKTAALNHSATSPIAGRPEAHR